MGEAKVRQEIAAREEQKRRENVRERASLIALLAAIMYPTEGDGAVDTADRLLDEGFALAEKRYPPPDLNETPHD